MSIKKLALLAILTAISLAVFIAEAQIPPAVPLPGAKLGLANIITLCCMVLLGRREALLVFTARAILGGLLASGFSALIFSLAGGLCAWAVMAALLDVFGEKLVWVTSIFGALAHNAGQLVMAALIMKTAGVFLYGPALAAAAIAAGAFTGIVCRLLLPALRKIIRDMRL